MTSWLLGTGSDRGTAGTICGNRLQTPRIRCSTFINDILDFSKIEAGRLELEGGGTLTCASAGTTLKTLAVLLSG